MTSPDLSDLAAKVADGGKCICPNCGDALGLNLIADLTRDSAMKFSLTPKDGAWFDAKTVGGSIEAMGSLMASIGKQMGAPTSLLIEKIETESDGTITCHFLVARNRTPSPKTRAKKS